MGHIVKVTCPKCSLNKELYLGHGMHDYSIEKIITYLPEDSALKVEQLYRANKIKSFEFNKYLSICSICKQLEETPLLEITLQSGTNMQFSSACAHCKGDITIIRDDFTKNVITCPICREIPLEVRHIGYWD